MPITPKDRTPLHYLKCPFCGEDVFKSAEPLWHDGLVETCSECGAGLRVNVDDGQDPPIAYADVVREPAERAPSPSSEAAGRGRE
jgi:transcription elongation factor Elf1